MYHEDTVLLNVYALNIRASKIVANTDKAKEMLKYLFEN